MKNRIFQIVLEPPDFNFKKALDKYGLALAREIINRLTYAIDNQLDSIKIVEIILPDDDILDFWCSKPLYIETLEENMKTLIKYEDYENCIICKNYIDLLKKDLVDK